MTTKRITKTQAKQVLAQVRKRFAPYLDEGTDGPTLVMDFDWCRAGGPSPAIVWEGGPYEWAILATSGGVDEEMASLAAEAGITTTLPQVAPLAVPGVFLEPITSWALGLYRA